LDDATATRIRMNFCALCGEPISADPATALITVRSASGQMAAFMAHTRCVIERFHPTARAILDAAPVVPVPD
jgi:hypothetical protein